MASVSSVTEICNLALDRIGWTRSIGNIYEGTVEARVALRAYGQTRDDVLKSQDWDFAERFVVLTAASEAPPQVWQYAFNYPTDCLKVRYVMGTGAGPNDLDPRPTLFDDLNFTSGGTQYRLIVANTSPATLCYTGQVTDMTTWDAGFVEAVVEELGRRFAEGLNSGPNVVVTRANMASRSEADLAGSQTTVPPILPRAANGQVEPRQQ